MSICFYCYAFIIFIVSNDRSSTINFMVMFFLIYFATLFLLDVLKESQKYCKIWKYMKICFLVIYGCFLIDLTVYFISEPDYLYNFNNFIRIMCLWLVFSLVYSLKPSTLEETMNKENMKKMKKKNKRISINAANYNEYNSLVKNEYENSECVILKHIAGLPNEDNNYCKIERSDGKFLFSINRNTYNLKFSKIIDIFVSTDSYLIGDVGIWLKEYNGFDDLKDVKSILKSPQNREYLIFKYINDEKIMYGIFEVSNEAIKILKKWIVDFYENKKDKTFSSIDL